MKYCELLLEFDEIFQGTRNINLWCMTNSPRDWLEDGRHLFMASFMTWNNHAVIINLQEKGWIRLYRGYFNADILR